MFKQYKVWDLPTRLFHWINFTTVVLLMLVGTLMLFKKDLGISSLDAKIAIKTLHVWIGYVFVLNLIFRLLWGFIGNRFARWKNILPGRGFASTLAAYRASIKCGKPQQFLGHNPLGRLAVICIMLLLMTQAVTGLIRAGTDIYYPPFGSMVAARVAAPGVDPTSIKPYDKTNTDPEKLNELRAFKHIYGELHYYVFFALLALALLHITAVVHAEVVEGNNLVSAMLSGRKTLSAPPEDDLQQH